MHSAAILFRIRCLLLFFMIALALSGVTAFPVYSELRWLIAGPIRSIPWFHILIDCSFGLIGLIPLGWALRLIRKLELGLDVQPEATS
jgi:hypothetical protein